MKLHAIYGTTYKDLEKENKHLNLQLDQALKEYEELQIRIDKAIDYINKHKIEWVDKKFEIHNVMVKFNEYTNPQELLEILGGDSDGM